MRKTPWPGPLVLQWWLQARLLLSTCSPVTSLDPITARSVPARIQSLANVQLDRPHRLTFKAPSLSPHAALSGWGRQGGREPRYTRNVDSYHLYFALRPLRVGVLQAES